MNATNTNNSPNRVSAWIAPVLATGMLLALPFAAGCATSSAQGWAETAPTVRQGQPSEEVVNLGAWPE
ncbi:MAG: hypothetical protein GY715_07650 [Planctomycetes bacterium]|nr:hypothetical protein [Planctomycetota bacterium]